jgi:hypothetical protein
MAVKVLVASVDGFSETITVFPEAMRSGEDD